MGFGRIKRLPERRSKRIAVNQDDLQQLLEQVREAQHNINNLHEQLAELVRLLNSQWKIPDDDIPF